MAEYLVRRVAHALVVLWAAFTASFLLLYALPGDAALRRAGASSEGAVVDLAKLEQIRESMGLNDPLIVQYFRILGNALRGDFGTSLQTGIPAQELFFDAVPETLKLAGFAFVLAVAVGLSWALIANYTRHAWLRKALVSLPALGVSVPTFWVGLLALQFFSFRLGWFPAFGNAGFSSLVLPAVVLAIPSAAVASQIFSRSLEESLAAPYIETVRARGASRRRVLLGHASRNAILPVMTSLGMTAGHLIGGSVVVETVFSRSGIGMIAVNAVNFQDTPVVLLTVTFAATVFVVVNLAIDLTYPIVDRRIQLRSTAPQRTRFALRQKVA